MNNRILFQDNNHENDPVRKDWDDQQWLSEFYEFLKGEIPEGMQMRRSHKPKMSAKKAFAIIWYLQEHFRVLPDNIDKCDGCGELFNSDQEGVYWHAKEKSFCSSCFHLAPQNQYWKRYTETK